MNILGNIRMRSLHLIAGVLALGSIFASCKDNDDAYQSPELTIEGVKNETIEYAQEGGSTNFTLHTNRKWIVSNSSSWLDVSPKEGSSGSHTITVKVLPNTAVARQGQLLIKAGTKAQAITIKQAGSGNPEEPQFEGMPLAKFLETYDKGTDIPSINEDIFFEAVVLTDVAQANQPFGKLIVVQAGEVGIPVILKDEVRDLKPGEVVRIKAKGAKLAYFNDVSLQLTLPNAASFERKGQMQTLEPKALTIAQIYEGKYDNILVQVSGVQFINTDGTLVKGSKTTNHQITDCQPTPEGKNKVSVTVFKNAKFGTEAIPEKRGSVTGVLQLTKDKNDKTQIRFYNIAPRSLADMQMTEDRCQEGDTPKPQPGETIKMSLADFVKKYDKGADAKVEEAVELKVTLLNDIAGNNMQSLLNLVVQEGSQGITLRLPKGSKPQFAKDAELKVLAQGATVKRYSGSLQIDFTDVADALTGNKISATGQTKSLTPAELTVEQLQEQKIENILVKISKTQLKDTNGVLNADSKKSAYLPLDTDPALTDKVTLSVGISAYAPFKGDARPTGSGSIVGILSKNISKEGVCQYTLWPRTKADMALTAPRFGETPKPDPTPDPKPNPKPEPKPTPSDTDIMIITYVEGTKMNKYIQIYNPTDAEIDLAKGGYSLQMDNYSGDDKNGKKSGIKKLVLEGKLGVKQTMVFAHTQATIYTGDATKNAEVINFNGNDNVALFKGDTMIDVVGTWGNIWLNGTKGAAKDITLHRKASISKPNATYTSSEWDEHKKDDVTTLGKR
ncbi:MAG: DUF5689 domain-containing protein [Porphyromonadaceae bacterium]|nr:DUF5689 domain-containing protein [Porphyromonadaceae bacterium]